MTLILVFLGLTPSGKDSYFEFSFLSSIANQKCTFANQK